MSATDAEIARALLEVIAALDRRVPRLERVGEASIVRDADALRERARARLGELLEHAVLMPLDPPR